MEIKILRLDRQSIDCFEQNENNYNIARVAGLPMAEVNGEGANELKIDRDYGLLLNGRQLKIMAAKVYKILFGNEQIKRLTNNGWFYGNGLLKRKLFAVLIPFCQRRL